MSDHDESSNPTILMNPTEFRDLYAWDLIENKGWEEAAALDEAERVVAQIQARQAERSRQALEALAQKIVGP